MKAPPLWVGAALLFWGWQTALWVVALPLAVIIEAARWLPWRLNLGSRQFNRIWDLGALSWISVGIYLYYEYEITWAVITAIKWLPIFTYPLLAAQAYSTRPAINRGTFFWLLRRGARQDGTEPPLDVSFAYGAVCVLSAAAANVRDLRFYTGVTILVGYALLANRPRRALAPVTLLLFGVVVVFGYALGGQLRAMQSHLEAQTARWIYGWLRSDMEGEEGYSRIGSFGPLKMSGRIVLKIQGEIPARPPDLLRQITFNRYEPGSWYAVRREYRPVAPDGENAWTVLPDKKVRRSAVVAMRLPRKRALLPLALGTARISELPVAEMDLNRLGTVRVANGPETLEYRFSYGPGATADAAPNSIDLEVPKEEEALLRKVVTELGLTNQPPERAAATLLWWFQKNFRYSLDLPTEDRMYPRRAARQVVTRFLSETRAGHCEHFATATALLLRAAGIPTRYAVGYAVQESARSGNSFIVRERHAHAWVLAHINGRWTEIDTTPPLWDEQEREKASIFRPLSEWFSEMRFRFMLWRFEDHTGLPPKYLFVPLGILTAFIGWRIFARKHRNLLVRKRRRGEIRIPRPGLDSEFYEIEARLRRMGLERQKGETLAAWLKRVEKPELKPTLDLHYRYRFDPESLTAAERVALASEAKAWLERS
jgi:transglutaminase-like putative cysteine protease